MLLQILWELLHAFIHYFQHIQIDNPENHIILITGCGSGFGLMTVHRLLQLRYYVVAICSTEKGAKELEEYAKLKGNNNLIALQCDVTKEQDVQRVYELLSNLLNADKKLKLWAIVNNAGVALSGFADWLSLDSYRRTLEVNFFAVVSITKLFLQLMKRCKDSRIINISSMAGIDGSPNISAYCASKHALEGFSKCLRFELLPWNIHVTNINPGIMRTPIIEKVKESRLKEFENGPKEITVQYPVANLTLLDKHVQALEEDPILAVNCIVDSITRAAPPLNRFPGKCATDTTWRLWLTPTIIRHVIEAIAMKYSGFGPYPQVLKQFQG